MKKKTSDKPFQLQKRDEFIWSGKKMFMAVSNEWEAWAENSIDPTVQEDLLVYKKAQEIGHTVSMVL